MPENPLDLVVQERSNVATINVLGVEEYTINIEYSQVSHIFEPQQWLWILDRLEDPIEEINGYRKNVFDYAYEDLRSSRPSSVLCSELIKYIYMEYVFFPVVYSSGVIFIDKAYDETEFVPVRNDFYAHTNVQCYSDQDKCVWGFYNGSEDQDWIHNDDSVFCEYSEEYYINDEVAEMHGVTWRDCCQRYYSEYNTCCDEYDDDADQGSTFDYTLKQVYNKPTFINMSRVSGMQYTYGVEIETANSSSVSSDSQINWKSVYDGSTSGLEFVSGVMHGNKGLDNIKQMCDKLQDATVDRKCGVHIHVGGAIFNRRFSIMIAKLCKQIEEDIYAMQPPSRHSNQYCTKLPDYVHDINFNNYKEKLGTLIMNTSINRDYNKKKRHPGGHYNSQRYYWLNMTNYSCVDGPNTVEFRCHSATTDYNKIYMWLLMCMSIVKFAENQQRRIWMSGLSSRANITLKDVIRYSLNDKLYEQVWSYYQERVKRFKNNK